MKKAKSTNFVCECGSGFETAVEFSNHVHFTCKVSLLNQPSQSWFEKNPEFKQYQEAP